MWKRVSISNVTLNVYWNIVDLVKVSVNNITEHFPLSFWGHHYSQKIVVKHKGSIWSNLDLLSVIITTWSLFYIHHPVPLEHNGERGASWTNHLTSKFATANFLGNLRNQRTTPASWYPLLPLLKVEAKVDEQDSS